MPAIQEWKTRAAEHLRRDSEDWKIAPGQARLLILIPFSSPSLPRQPFRSRTSTSGWLTKTR